MSSRTFDLNGLARVSMAEMDCAPLQTTQIVAEIYGWEWASRLWQYWHGTLPDMGEPGIEAYRRSREVRDWLDSRRPA